MKPHSSWHCHHKSNSTNPKTLLSTVEVTLRYHLMTHHLVLVCLTTVSVNDSVSDTVTKLVYYPFSYVFIEALEPHSIDRVLLSDLSVRHLSSKPAQS